MMHDTLKEIIRDEFVKNGFHIIIFGNFINIFVDLDKCVVGNIAVFEDFVRCHFKNIESINIDFDELDVTGLVKMFMRSM